MSEPIVEEVREALDRLKAWGASPTSREAALTPQVVADIFTGLSAARLWVDAAEPDILWLHCSPEMINGGLDCGNTERRDCQCDPPGSHDHALAAFGDNNLIRKAESQEYETIERDRP